jgi:hypothetical protein
MKIELHLARLNDLRKGRIWVVFNEKDILYGESKESRNKLIKRWTEKHTRPTDLIRFKGVCRPSELVVCISTIQSHSNIS